MFPVPGIESVTVDTFPNDGRVTITWEKIDHSDLNSYMIYEIREDGSLFKIHIENDVSKLSYQATEAEADESSVGFVMANKYISSDTSLRWAKPHYTIFVDSSSFNTCDSTLEVIWNNYIGWKNGVKIYNVWLKRNNKPYVLLETKYGDNDTVSIIKNVIPNSTYKVYVVAISNSGVESLSNIAEMNTEPENPINLELLYIDTVLYDGTSVELKYNVDNTIEILKYDIHTKNIPEEPFKHLVFVESTGAERYKYTHNGVDNTNPGYYRIDAIGVCDDSLATTNTVKQLILQGFVSNNIASFTWNYCFEEYGDNYTVWLDVDGRGFQKLEETIDKQGAQINLIELSDSEGSAEYFCFKVSAHNSNNYYGESNTICFTLTPEVNMATAFTPNGDGLNETIGPTIEHADISEYLFIVYDRYGGKVFETKSYEMRWDGKAGSKSVSEGAYLYYLKFSTSRGQSFEKSGTINLIYP